MATVSDNLIFLIELTVCGIVVLICELLRIRSDREERELLERARREWRP